MVGPEQKERLRNKIFRDLLCSNTSEYASSRVSNKTTGRALRLSYTTLPCSAIRHAFYTNGLMSLDLAYAFIGHDGAVAVSRLIRTCRSLITLSVRNVRALRVGLWRSLEAVCYLSLIHI